MTGAEQAVRSRLVTTTGGLSDEELAGSLPGTFESGYADVGDVRLHYVAGGQGPALVLLPGYPETWWAFAKTMPALAERHRVIAVDLRGMGGSSHPPAGHDLRTMADDVHGLLAVLGYQEADLVGHDVGAMVAHVHALHHPEATRSLTLVNVVAPDRSLYALPMLPVPGLGFHPWWWGLNSADGVVERLLAGRSRALVDVLIDGLARHPEAITDRDRSVYAQAYATPEALRSSSGWYRSLGQGIAAGTAEGTVTVPVLGIAGEANAGYLDESLRNRATGHRLACVADSGHYVAEEQPDRVVEALRSFLGG